MADNIKHPGQLILRASLDKLLNFKSLTKDWAYWRGVMRKELLLDDAHCVFLEEATGVCKGFWKNTQRLYLDEKFRGVSTLLMRELSIYDVYKRLRCTIEQGDELWNAAVLAAYLPAKDLQSFVQGAGLKKQHVQKFFATLHMLNVYPALLESTCDPDVIEVYTDGGFKGKYAGWAFYIPEFNLTRAGITRSIRNSSQAEAKAIEKAFLFARKNYPDRSICIYTDCESLSVQWQDGRFKRTNAFLNLLFRDNFTILRWCSHHVPAIAIADEACTQAMNPARKKRINT